MGEDRDVILSRGPLLYRLRSYQNHLVIQIQNETSQPLQLLGGQSFVVDPDGQSHPLDEQTIAPNRSSSWCCRQLCPRLRGRTRRWLRARRQLGLRAGIRRFLENPLLVRPGYCASADLDNRFWKWEGESNVQLSLTFGHAGSKAEPFTQAFVFHRHKM